MRGFGGYRWEYEILGKVHLAQPLNTMLSIGSLAGLLFSPANSSGFSHPAACAGQGYVECHEG